MAKVYDPEKKAVVIMASIAGAGLLIYLIVTKLRGDEIIQKLAWPILD